MAFRNTVNADYHTHRLGENGMPEYTTFGVGSDVLALSQMVRGGNPLPLVDKILQEGSTQDVVDLMVLVFATRNTRGGKGEKKLAYDMFLRVYCKALPQTALALMMLFPHFGYWKDLLQLIKLIKEKPCVPQAKKAAFFKAATKIMSDQLAKYMSELELWKETSNCKLPSISLLAKWLPRENAALDKSTGVVDALAKGLMMSAAVAGGSSTGWQSKAKRVYRKTVSQLTAQLALPEVLLAAQREEEIDFGRVASRATMLYRRVFLNLDKKGLATRSENPKRVALAERFLEHTIEEGLKGSQLMPHEIVAKIIGGSISEVEEIVLDAQWKSLRESVLEQIKSAQEGDAGMEPTRLVPLSDVSGSMCGTPMDVSIALGILLSEITHPAFRDMVMTFETNPRWHRLDPSATIVKKVRCLASAPWGGSTDFVAAYRLVLDVARKHRLKREEVPNLIVFSDMQFNEADGSDEATIHEVIKREFEKTASFLGWEDKEPTAMVYWNLRNTGGHPVSRDTEGAVMLSGFSPSLLKLVMSGMALEEQDTEVVEADGTVSKVKVKVTPGVVLRKMLDDELYDPVRAILGSSTEGKLKEFEIVPIEAKEDDFPLSKQFKYKETPRILGNFVTLKISSNGTRSQVGSPRDHLSLHSLSQELKSPSCHHP